MAAAHCVAAHTPRMTIAKTTAIWPIRSLVGVMSVVPLVEDTERDSPVTPETLMTLIYDGTLFLCALIFHQHVPPADKHDNLAAADSLYQSMS